MQNKKEKEKIYNKNELYKTTYFKKDDFRKIENICFAKSVSNKSAIILFHKRSKNKYNIHTNNFSQKSNLGKDKTLNNTFHKINDIIKMHKNNSYKINKINNSKKYNKNKSTNQSSLNYSPIETLKKFKNKKIIPNNDSSSNNNNITNISVCLTNINMFHKNNGNYSPSPSPSFCKKIKKIKNKKTNLNFNNKNKNQKIRSKTFNSNFLDYYDKIKYDKEKEKNKTLLEKKMKYFLDYCKDDIESLLVPNSELEEEKNIPKNITHNNLDNHNIIKKRSKTTINNKSHNNKNININKKRNYIINDELNKERYNTFNYGNSNLKETNSFYYSHNISSINKKDNKTINNNLEKSNHKKPRVDTFEYLAKILNSINTSNIIKSLQKSIKKEEIGKKNEKNEQTDFFRKKNKNNNMNKNKILINERRFKKNNNIKVYIENKKKLFKINDMQKKKKGKENYLKKYIQLYKLQENINNYSNNNINNINTKILSKIKNNFYCGKNNINKTHKIIKNKENLSSSQSTIIDKPNYYQNILDIQNIYNNNTLNLDNKNINPPYINENKEKILKYENEEKNKIIINKDIDDNICNNKDNNIQLNQIKIDINDSNKKNFNVINNINNEEVFFKCQNTLEKANKIIGGKKVEYLINNFKNINFKNEENKEEENNNNYIIDFKNDYSFKLNDSNSNDMNSYQTSKFCNSQVISEEKRIEEKEKEKEKNNEIKQYKDENINNNNNKITEQNIFINNSFKKDENYNYDNDEENKTNTPTIPSIELPPTIQLLSGSDTREEKKLKEKEDKNSIQNKYDFNEEKLENYKEILTSLFEYLKLITQRNALNDIITYGDKKYKYKIGFEQLIILIKSIPFNVIRAIQQSQYYTFVFRHLFIPYISRAFHKLKLYSLKYQFFAKIGQILKYIFKKIIFKKIKNFKKNNIELNNNIINDNLTIKSLEEIEEIKNININKIEKNENKIEIKNNYKYSEEDISANKEKDSIEWDNTFINGKQITNRDNSNIIKDFSKIYNNSNSYSADYNVSIQEIIFEDDKNK